MRRTVKKEACVLVVGGMYWIYGVIVIVILFYIRYYYTSPSEVTILQTSLHHFQFSMLREKQPIVIHDRVQDIESLKKAWFGPNITKAFSLEATKESAWTENRYKYFVLHAQQDCEVLLAPSSEKLVNGVPNPETTTLVAIQLAALQTVILPYRMKYLLQPKSAAVATFKAIGAHDYVTFLLP